MQTAEAKERKRVREHNRYLADPSIRARNQAYAASHREEARTRGKAWRATRDPDIHKARKAAHYIANRDEILVRQAISHRKWKYGLTPAQHDDLLESQAGLCAGGCGRPATFVDHDHKTGRVRGLLCRWCNSVLGHAKDDPRVLRSLIDYFECATRNNGCLSSADQISVAGPSG